MPTDYPNRNPDRDRWVLAQRPPRPPLDPYRPHSFFLEDECDQTGAVARVATVFLTNRECPWRCVMCDLWQYALAQSVPAGAIPAQIDFAFAQLQRTGGEPATDRQEATVSRPPRQVKLYNAGSFFDPHAIPPDDYPAIATRLRSFARVIVECHPALVGVRTLRFRDLLAANSPARRPGATGPRLEIAMGLETAHSLTLAKLNKRMTLGQFQRAAQFLRREGIALRVFVLVQPPFLPAAEAALWTRRSVDFAFACGATVVSLIRTRRGNGAIEALAARGEFSPPTLLALEAAAEYGVALRRGRVFADLWGLESFADCPACLDRRLARLRDMNLRQTVPPRVPCEVCGAHTRHGARPFAPHAPRR